MKTRKALFEAVKPLTPNGAYDSPALIASVDALADALGLPKDGVVAQKGKLDETSFFAKARELFGAFEPKQVAGIQAILGAWSGVPVQWAAYGFATAWHETNATMEPVREAYWLSENWRKRNLRYYPHYGRGYVQLTWPKNYRLADEKLGLNGTLVANPDRAMEPEIAAQIMRLGMVEGWFTRYKLSDVALTDYVGMRKIINGTDDDDQIAAYARKWEQALRAGGLT